MATITYRGAGAWGSGKGSKLTNAEVDGNFYSLNQTKIPNDAPAALTNTLDFNGPSDTTNSRLGVSLGKQGNNPEVVFKNPARAADEKLTDLIMDQSDGIFKGRFINDAFNAAADWLRVSRVGYSPSAIFLGVRPQWNVSRTDATLCTAWDNQNFNPANYAALASANQFTADQSLVGASTSRYLNFNVAAGNTGAVRFNRTGAVQRWEIGTTGEAESSGDAGSNFYLNSYTDAGAFKSTVLKFTRSTGALAISTRPTFAGNLAWDAGNFNPANYLALNSPGQINGWVTVNNTAATSMVNIVADANQEKRIQFGNNAGGPSRWAIAASGDSNGRDLYFNRSDASGNYVDSPIVLRSADGRLDVGTGGIANYGNLAINGGAVDRYLTFSTNAGRYRAITVNTAGSTRWQWGVTGEAESGSNAGSNYFISRWADDGSGIDTIFQINRASGLTSINKGLTVNYGDLTVNASGSNARYMILNGPAGQTKAQRITSGGSPRWEWGSENSAESGSNAGSNWYLNRYSDAGAYIDTPVQISRASGQATFSTRPKFGASTAWDTGNFNPFIGAISGGDESDLAVNTNQTRLSVNFTAGPGGACLVFGSVRFEGQAAGAVDIITSLQVIDTTNSAVAASGVSLVSTAGPWINSGAATAGLANQSPLVAAGGLVPGRTYQIRMVITKNQPVGPIYPRNMAVQWIGY